MSLGRLRLVDVHDKEEEDMLQEIINSKLVNLPPQGEAFRGDVPDIKTPEQEAEWQAKIDERNAKIKGAYVPTASLTPTSLTVEVEGSGELLPSGEIISDPIKEVGKKFCDKCDSKGGIHKKGCPNKVSFVNHARD
jgi:hypothetical protein